MKEYCVYCHTTPSNRKYVGISCDPIKRWRNGKGYEKNYIFTRAIEKYGWENIKHEILYDGLSEEEAKTIERKLIAEWNLTDAEYGLNLSGGGEGALSEHTKALMSQARKGNKYCVGRVLSDDTKGKIAESLRSYYAVHGGTFTGRHHTEETKEKLRNRIITPETRAKLRANHRGNSGVNNPSHRAIDQLALDGTFIKRFATASLASQEVRRDLSTIIKCCRGKAKTCGGYKWRYATEIE